MQSFFEGVVLLTVKVCLLLFSSSMLRGLVYDGLLVCLRCCHVVKCCLLRFLEVVALSWRHLVCSAA